MEKNKKLGLGSVVSVSVGLVIATSCLVSLGQGAGTVGIPFIGAMIIACLLNMTTVASLSELNGLMPNTTGGLAQYTLACMGPFPTMISMVGGYLICNILSCGVEASIFAYAMSQTLHLPIPSIGYTIIMTVIVMVANLFGVDMLPKFRIWLHFCWLARWLLWELSVPWGLGPDRLFPSRQACQRISLISCRQLRWHSGCLLVPNMSFQYPKMLKMPNETCRLV